MSIFSDIGNAVSSAVSTVAHVGEDVVKGAEGAVEGVIGTVAQNPLNLLNPLSILGGAAQGAISGIEGNCNDSQTNVLRFNPNSLIDISKYVGPASDNTTSDLGGSSIEAVLLQLASKERGALADKVNQLKNLQVPGQNSTPQDQANYDSTKTELMADIQSLQNSIQQITTMATNVEKTDSDTNMSIVRNLAS